LLRADLHWFEKKYWLKGVKEKKVLKFSFCLPIKNGNSFNSRRTN
jgi:hypothetical protein